MDFYSENYIKNVTCNKAFIIQMQQFDNIPYNFNIPNN